jgi:transcriptional regulator with XRE-family HTH domain
MLVTLTELALTSGVSVAELQQIETGEYVPTNGCLERIAKALGVKTVPTGNSLASTLLATERECEESRLQRLHTNV